MILEYASSLVMACNSCTMSYLTLTQSEVLINDHTNFFSLFFFGWINKNILMPQSCKSCKLDFVPPIFWALELRYKGLLDHTLVGLWLVLVTWNWLVLYVWFLYCLKLILKTTLIWQVDCSIKYLVRLGFLCVFSQMRFKKMLC